LVTVALDQLLQFVPAFAPALCQLVAVEVLAPVGAISTRNGMVVVLGVIVPDDHVPFA
jgi:hypothetical protein